MDTADPTTLRKGSSQAPVLAYRNVIKRFGSFVALAGVSAEVRKGEVVCLIGPSGSGKSTLLRCTNGLELIDDGRIILDGELLPRDWEGMRRVRQRMGMVFQNFELFPHKTALGNVTIGPMTVLGLSREAAEKRALALLEKVGLADKAASYPTGAICPRNPNRPWSRPWQRPLAGQGPPGGPVTARQSETLLVAPRIFGCSSAHTRCSDPGDPGIAEREHLA